MASSEKRFGENDKIENNMTSNLQIDTTKLETEVEKRARIRSLWVISIQTFIFALSFSIVITGVLPYLRQVRLFNSIRFAFTYLITAQDNR